GAALSYQIIFTKSDQVTATELALQLTATSTALTQHPAAYPELMATSSRTGAGVPELRAAIARLLAERAA
ncbi:MAG: YihA family ribosome biogenesis GTP-binding protein, partial [Bradyrhizobiaceae bacterium]|nr:YihA family ribosome biogenesis GTP-binding protein [Bradyrhizobiaceae bacterium]